MNNLHIIGERVCGPCEWKEHGAKYHLGQHLGPAAGWVRWRFRRGKDVDDGFLSDHEALCLRRNQVDEWLAERGLALTPDFKDGVIVGWGLCGKLSFGFHGQKWPDRDSARAKYLRSLVYQLPASHLRCP